METPADRLKKVREEKYDSAAEAARAMGIAAPTYQGHENGSRGLTRAAAVRYAAFFRINLDWLLQGRGKPRSQSEVQRLFDEISPELQSEAWRYLEYMKSRG